MKTLRGEDTILGNLLYLGKKAPTPRLKINPYLMVSPNNRLLLTDEQRQYTHLMNNMLSDRGIKNTKVDAILNDGVTTDMSM
jgi:hypothetical protein